MLLTRLSFGKQTKQKRRNTVLFHLARTSPFRFDFPSPASPHCYFSGRLLQASPEQLIQLPEKMHNYSTAVKSISLERDTLKQHHHVEGWAPRRPSLQMGSTMWDVRVPQKVLETRTRSWRKSNLKKGGGWCDLRSVEQVISKKSI